MRQFGKDTPEFFCFQLEGKKKTYKIPLAASLSNDDLFAFEDSEGDYRKQVEWLARFMGDDIKSLTPYETSEIIKAWAEESRGQGAEAGES